MHILHNLYFNQSIHSISQVYDKIKASAELSGTKDTNIYTACIYIACKMSKTKVDVKMSGTVGTLVKLIVGLIKSSKN